MSDFFVNIPGDGVLSLNGLVGNLTIAAGSGINVVTSGSTITISNTEAGGTVTSVGLADGSTTPLYSITNSPVTTTGTLTFTLNTQTANKVLAGPTSGGATQPTFRSLVSADIPNNAANTTGTASNITASSNSTLTTLSALSLPYSQVTGVPPISGFTQGSVLFANSSGQISQDNSQFYWDDTNHALGIGVIPATTAVLDVVNNSGSLKAVQTTGYGAAVPFRGRYANGTLSSPTAATTGNTLGVFSGRGYGTSQFAVASTGAVNILAQETFTNTSNATAIGFNVTPTGSVTTSQAMLINSTGNVLIGTSTDNGVDKLQFNSTGGISANYVKFAGTTSGYVDIIAPSTASTYNLSLPSAQGAASSYLLNDGSGNLSWTTGTPPVITNNIDGGNSASLYTSPQLIVGGSA